MVVGDLLRLFKIDGLLECRWNCRQMQVCKPPDGWAYGAALGSDAAKSEGRSVTRETALGRAAEAEEKINIP